MTLNEKEIEELRRSATDIGEYLRLMERFGLPVRVGQESRPTIDLVNGETVHGTKIVTTVQISANDTSPKNPLDGNGGYAFELEFVSALGGAKFSQAWVGVENGSWS